LLVALSSRVSTSTHQVLDTLPQPNLSALF
jgi:hypothetical protein